jgi:hypothetical protein
MVHHGSSFIINSIVVGKVSDNIRFYAIQSNTRFSLARGPGAWMAGEISYRRWMGLSDFKVPGTGIPQGGMKIFCCRQRLTRKVWCDAGFVLQVF